MLRSAVARGAIAVVLAGTGAAVLTFGSTGTASPDTPAAPVTVIASNKSDGLCGDAQWPPSDGGCLRSIMAKSGRAATVRIVGSGATVVERPMTDRERIDAAFVAAASRQDLASRDRSTVAR